MDNYKGLWAGLSLATLSLTLPSVVSAQDLESANLQPRNEAGREIYNANQFERFNPRTALDMVRQVPGFVIDSGDEDERGLGQADENVLINGARIAGKNTDAETALQRISASNVVRIEIVDGATLSITGLSGQVLNLVTSSDGNNGVSGNFKWEPRFRRSGDSWLNGEVSINGKLGKGDFTLAIVNEQFRSGVQGPERVTDRFGNLIFRRDPEIARFPFNGQTVSGSYARTSEAGTIFNLSAEVAFPRQRTRIDTTRITANQPDILELFTRRENEWNAELNIDYEFALGGGRLKLIGLQRLEHSPVETFFGETFTDGVTPPTGDLLERTLDEGETVLRSEYSWSTGSGTDWGINLEGAYNFLDAEGIRNGTPLANGNSKVTEYRGELIGSFGRALSDKLTIQASLGGEYSQISQTGANGLTRSFIRPKGSVTLSLKPSNSMDLSLKVEREVGQLDFFDFVESVEVDQNIGNAGNPNLVPTQSWRAEIEMTKRLGPWGSGTVTIFGEKITDVVDAIPIDTTNIVNGMPVVVLGETRGNLPKASRFGVGLVSSILFDPIGWKGAKLDFEGNLAKSSIEDPVTGIFRRTNNDEIFSYEINFRHDIPNSDWAWGGSIEDDDNSDNLRLDQINDFNFDSVFATVFVEHKDVFGLTVRGALNNLFNRSESFTRTNFVNRRDGPIDFVEDRRRKFGLIYQLTVSGSF
ncbi:MAG: TonB-dependent receptor plug domain-containing protein [Parasphingorhabdus sp.]